jgi:peptidoglycan-associated lipoprotein
MKLDALKHGFAIILAGSILVGCETTSTSDDAAEAEVEAAEQTEQGTAASSGDSMSEQEMAEKQAQDAAMKEQAAMREVRTFYFDLDQSTIKSESRAPLAAHAAFLAANPGVKVVLEGHCDERGTKEYNLALGERRAKSVAQFLKVNGASDAQLELISFGEERPAMMGSNESAWSKNRRVVIQYQ